MLHIYKKDEALEHLKTLQPAQPAELNIFNHPAFLRPAFEFFAAGHCGMITFENSQTNFLMPFQVAKAGLGWTKAIHGWSNLYATQGTPLISIDAMAETLNSVLNELSKSKHKLPDVLLLPQIRLNAPFAQALHTIAEQNNLPLQILRQEERPVLISSAEPAVYLAQAIGKNHLRECRRLKRRLSETGNLEYRIAADKAAVLNAFESFLTLEAAGWKGKYGTAFLSKQRDADFARQAVYNLAEQNLVRIHMLTLDDRLIASLVVFIDDDQAWTWKTAYDENLKSYSPGVLLMIEALQNHLQNPALHMTDSCAIPDHPVMSRLFHERETFGTIILGLTAQSHASLCKITRQLNHYDQLRATLRNLKSRFQKYLNR